MKIWKYMMLCVMVMVASTTVAISTQAVNTPVSVELEVENVIKGDKPQKHLEYQYILEADDASYPMPISSVVTITGEGGVKFDPITYITPGVYTYTLVQDVKSEKNYIMDDACYGIMMYVTTDSKGVLDAMVVAMKEGADKKSKSITFNNQFRYPKQPASGHPQTGDDSQAMLWLGMMVLVSIMSSKLSELSS